MRPIVAKALATCLALGAAGGFFGCSADETVNPLGGSTGEAGGSSSSASSGSGGSGGSGPVTPKRTILERNPFGNVAEVDNLLWDGDFEWASPFSDQYGWLKGLPLSYSFDGIVVGPSCRSGVQCASLAKNKALAGLAVAAKGRALFASIWAKPDTPSCDNIEVQVAALFGGNDPDVDVPAVSATPDVDGWCNFNVVTDERIFKPFLYIRNRTDGVIVVDDAVVKAAPSGAKWAERAPAGPPTAEAQAELQTFREELAKMTGPHDPPPNEARRAVEKWRP